MQVGSCKARYGQLLRRHWAGRSTIDSLIPQPSAATIRFLVSEADIPSANPMGLEQGRAHLATGPPLSRTRIYEVKS